MEAREVLYQLLGGQRTALDDERAAVEVAEVGQVHSLLRRQAPRQRAGEHLGHVVDDDRATR